MSASEKVLWNFLRKKQLGFRFSRQVPIDRYYLDFYCAEARLAVEVDGEQHHNRLELDAERDRRLAELGVETLRLRSLDLFTEEDSSLARSILAVLDCCEKRTGRKGHMPG